MESGGLLSGGYDQAVDPSISDDGRYVAFSSRSAAMTLYLNPVWSDIFVRDRLLGTLQLVSVSSSGIQGVMTHGDPALTPDGRHLVWASNSPNLVPDDTNKIYDIFLRKLM